MADTEGAEEIYPGILQEIFTSPLNLSLLGLCIFLLYKIFRGDKPADMGEVEEPLPKLKKRDFTLTELQPYDGLQNPRILMAVNFKVFDVTRGKKFYGPGKIRLFSCAVRRARSWLFPPKIMVGATVAKWLAGLSTLFLNLLIICMCVLLSCYIVTATILKRHSPSLLFMNNLPRFEFHNTRAASDVVSLVGM